MESLERAEKAESPPTGRKVVNPGNPAIMRNPGNLVTRKLANGMKFQKSKVSAPASHAIHSWNNPLR